MRLSLVALFTLTALSNPAQALDFGNGFSLNGEVELEAIDFGADSDSALWVDVTLGWRSQVAGTIGFGVDLGIDGFHNLDGGDQREVFWGGLVLTTSAGDLTLGAARPVLLDLFDLPKLGGSTLLDLELRSLTGPLSKAFAVGSDEQLYGISFRGASGDLTYAVSYHEPDSAPISFLEAGVTYQIGNSLLKAGIETVEFGGLDFTLLSLGGTQDFERLSLGLHLSELIEGPGHVTSVQLFGAYQVTEALVIEAMVQDVDASSGQFQGYGLSGEYGFGTGYARLGAAKIDGLGTDDTVLDAAVGFRF